MEPLKENIKNNLNKKTYKRYLLILIGIIVVALVFGVGSVFVFPSDQEVDFTPPQEEIDQEVSDIDNEIEEIEKQIRELEASE